MGITIHEFSDSLKQRLFDSNSSIIAEFTSRKVITHQQDEVEIGIDGFDAEMDSLIVYKNSVSLSPNVDYRISDDNKKIIATEVGIWGVRNTQTIFDFRVIKNIKDANRIDDIDLVDGSLLEDGCITKEKLNSELYNKIHSLPAGGNTGAILVKNSDQDYDIRWTTNTVCNVVINTFDNKSVEGVTIKIKNTSSGVIDTVQATGSINIIELVPGNNYEISVGDKDGYKRPLPQVISPILGNINTIFFMYNTELTTCSIGLETEDGQPIGTPTIFIRKVSDGTTKELQTNGVTNVYTVELLANTQYEIYCSDIDGYATPPKKVINTTSNGVSNVLIRYSKDEVFCDVELSGITLSPTDYVTITFRDLKTDQEYVHRLEARTTTIALKSNRSYEARVNEDKPGFVKPVPRYIRTQANKSSMSLPLAYEISSNVLMINVSTDDGKSVTGTEVTITDGFDYNKKLSVTESGTVMVQVLTKKTYTITVDKLTGYMRPQSQSVNIENTSTTVNFVYKKVDIYGFTLDLTNSDPATNIEYTDDAIGFQPMKVTNTGLEYGDWLNTFIIKDVKPAALVDGVRVGYLSLEEEGRLEDGELIPRDADLMAEFKKKYYLVKMVDNKLVFKISNYKVDNNYLCTAFLSEANGKTECDYMYYGMYEASMEESKLFSKRGKTIKKFENIDNFRTAVRNKGEGYQIETIAKLNYITLLTMLVSRCSDIKSFTGKPEIDAIGITSTSYSKFKLPLPNRTFSSSVNLFYINNLFNSPRYIDGCYLNGLKEIRYRKVGPYTPEINYSLLPTEKVRIGDALYVNSVKQVQVAGDMVFPVYEEQVNDATTATYMGSTVTAQYQEDTNVKLVLNNQASLETNEPGMFNYCFVTTNPYGARVTYTNQK